MRHCVSLLCTLAPLILAGCTTIHDKQVVPERIEQLYADLDAK